MEKGMLTMNQIDEIKELQRQGYGPLEVSKRLGIDRKTLSRYIKLESFELEKKKSSCKPSKFDPWKQEVDAWLDEDRRMRFKQRHTAKRVYMRLQELHPDFDCSYSIVQRYLKAAKASRRNQTGKRPSHAFRTVFALQEQSARNKDFVHTVVFRRWLPAASIHIQSC